MGDAAEDTAKKLNKMLMPFDELNNISSDSGSGKGAGGGAGGVGGGDLGVDLPQYDMFQGASSEMQKKIDGIKDKIKALIPFIMTAGVLFGSWKISKSISNFFGKEGFSGGLGGFAKLALMADIVKNMNEFTGYFQNFQANGATFNNVTGMIYTFASGLGDAFLILGNIKLGGALKLIAGVTEIVNAIKDMSENGINWENSKKTINGIGDIAIAIGALQGKIGLLGAGLALRGLTTAIDEIQKNWDAIKKGDWSGVDKAALITSAVETLGGVAVVIARFKKSKALADAGSGAKQLQGKLKPLEENTKNVSNTTSGVSSSTGTLSNSLKTLSKNLALGIVVIAEVAAAALLIVGSIILLGKGLEQVGKAWQPVIDNGAEVATAVGIGAGILVGVGVATALLGSVGGTLAVNMAIGTAVLAEIGVATAVFMVEIWGIGKALDEIRKAWDPVLSNGPQVATAVGVGTGILVAVGAATALIGTVTAGTAGTIPIAIGIGTAVLAEIGVATGLFLVEILGVGVALQKIAEAWQPVLDNEVTVTEGIRRGTTILAAVGAASAAIGTMTVLSAGTIPVAIGLGTAVLGEITWAVQSFVNNLKVVADALVYNLAPSLEGFNSQSEGLETNLDSFVSFMGHFALKSAEFSASSALSGLASVVDTIISFFTGDPIQRFSDQVQKTYDQTVSLNEKLRNANPELEEAIKLIETYENLSDKLNELTGERNNIMLSGNMFVNMKEVGKNIIKGLVEGVKSLASKVPEKFGEIKDAMTKPVDKAKELIEKGINMVKGFFNFDWHFPSLKKPHFSWGSQPAPGWISNILRVLNLPTSLPKLNIDWYASGGFPNQGDLFMANEAGPELVGKIGNKTSVANQKQITEGIASATYEAMSRALAENSGDKELNPTFIIKLGDKDIYRGFGKYKNQESNMYGVTI